jgi:hypothetical protein
MKKLLIVGNCQPDFVDLASTLEVRFPVKAYAALSIVEAMKVLEKDTDFDAILVNRSGYFDHKPASLLLDHVISRGLKIPVFVMSEKKESVGGAEVLSKEEILRLDSTSQAVKRFNSLFQE